MDETIFSIHDGELRPLVRGASLPDAFAATLPGAIDRLLGVATLTISDGTSSPAPDRPDLLVLDSSGMLRSVVVDRGEDDIEQRLSAIEADLIELTLRDLGHLASSPLEFYEGLWDLSPDEPIRLRGLQHDIFTADDDLSVPTERNARVERHVRVFDVYGTDDHPVLFGPRDQPAHLAEVIDLTTPASVAPVPTRTTNLGPAPLIVPGAHFLTERLPLVFDPAVADLSSLTDRLFAVGSNLVIVESIGEGSTSTFDAPDVFGWDTSQVDIEQFARHRRHPNGTERTVHLFIEVGPNGTFSMYVGRLIADGGSAATDGASTMTFTIDPPLHDDLFVDLHEGIVPAIRVLPTTELSSTTHDLPS